MFKDYFIESSINISGWGSDKRTSTLRDLALRVSDSSSIDVGDDLYLNRCRLEDTSEEDSTFDERAKEAIARFSGVSVANSYQELWENYERSAEYFIVDVIDSTGARKRLRLADLSPSDEVVGGIARAPGAYLGGSEFQVELVEGQSISRIQKRTVELSEAVRGSNDLSESERRDILGYLDAVSAILSQANPDKAALRMLLSKLAERIAKYTLKLGERFVTNEIIDFVKDVLGSGLP